MTGDMLASETVPSPPATLFLLLPRQLESGLHDAFYLIVISLSTVGYGDMSPVRARIVGCWGV